MKQLSQQQRRPARWIGYSILIMAITAGFSYGFAYQQIVEVEDSMATLRNLKAHGPLFTFSIVGWLIILITDLIVSWQLYKLFKDQQPLATLTSLFRFIYSGILAIAISYLVQVTWHVEMEYPADALIVMHNLYAFQDIWSMGLILFGIHLLFLGVVLKRSSFSSPVWSWLLVLAGISYTVVHTGLALAPQSDVVHLTETILLLPMTIGELGFAIWLLYRSYKSKPA